MRGNNPIPAESEYCRARITSTSGSGSTVCPAYSPDQGLGEILRIEGAGMIQNPFRSTHPPSRGWCEPLSVSATRALHLNFSREESTPLSRRLHVPAAFRAVVLTAVLLHSKEYGKRQNDQQNGPPRYQIFHSHTSPNVARNLPCGVISGYREIPEMSIGDFLMPVRRVQSNQYAGANGREDVSEA